MGTEIVDGPSIVFERHTEVGPTTIQMPDCCAEALPCCTLVGDNVNSLYLWGMVQDMPIGPCHVILLPSRTSALSTTVVGLPLMAGLQGGHVAYWQ